MFLHEWGHAVCNIPQPSAHIPFYRWRKFISLVSLVNILVVPNVATAGCEHREAHSVGMGQDSLGQSHK